MMLTRRDFSLLAGGLVSLPTFAQQAPWPSRAIRLVVPFAPGGSSEIVARATAFELSKALGQSVYVENKPGGGGRTVLEQVRNADADGTTVVLTPTAMLTIFPHVFRKLGYDALRDFTAVGSAATFVTAITAGPALPASVKTLPEFLQWAKQNPASASYGSPGAGTSLHFVGTMLARHEGISLNHVPYKGAAPMMQDLLGGQIPVGMAPIGDAVAQVRSGKLRVLATTGTQRSRFLPDVPTAVEAGYPEVVAEDYFAFFVPSRTPPDIVEALGRAIREALQNPELRERMAQLGLDARASTPAEMNEIVRTQYRTWAPVVKASGFTADD